MIDLRQNNTKFILKNSTLLSGISNFTFNTLNYNYGFLLYGDNQSYVNGNGQNTWQVVFNYS